MSKYSPSTDIVQRIKTQIPILDYLKESGYTPVKSGTHYWRLKESSSFVYDDAKDRFTGMHMATRAVLLICVLPWRGQRQKPFLF